MKSIFEAVSDNDVEALKKAIDEGADVNATDRDDMTPLMYGVRHVELMDVLIRHGAGVNSVDKFGNSALMFAACGGRVEATKFLLASGADVNASAMNGETALVRCSRLVCEWSAFKESNRRTTNKNKDEVIKVLLKAGADANLADAEGNTALMWAIKSRFKPGIVRDLLQAGADPNLEAAGEKPLNVAVDLCLSNFSYEGGRDDLKVIEQSAQLLVEYGADVNLRRHSNGRMSSTPLIDAVDAPGCCYVSDRLVMILAKQGGPHINEADWTGMTALHRTAYNGRQDFAEVLINAGADVNAFDNERRTPLIIAVSRNDASLTQLFLEAGADLGVTDKQGKTPFEIAMDSRSAEIIQVITEHRAARIEKRLSEAQVPDDRIAKAAAEHGPMTKQALESRASARKDARLRSQENKHVFSQALEREFPGRGRF
ncbi:MAG: ankyrin repeat domain-containing protein [Lysobacteraceae bacterium]